MADQRTMLELLRAPTEGYAEAIVVPPILVEQFELKHSLINMMTSDQFFGLENNNPHDHIRWFNKIISTIKYKDVPNSAIKLMLFPFSLAGAARRWLEKEPPRSIHTWEDLNALNPADQDSLNAAAGGNLLEIRTQDVLTIIENKSKVHNSRNKSDVSQVKSCDANSNSSSEIAKLTHAVNQQTSSVTTVITAILKQFQATSPPASVKSSTSRSGSLPSNTVANPKGELKAITTRSGLVVDVPTVPTPSPFINPEVDERVEETLTDPDLAEYTIKVPPLPVQKYKPPSQIEYVLHQRDPLHPNIPYPLRMLKQKQQEKDEFQIHKFWQMFKQLHINITLADALILMPKYQKMLKALLSNKEKLQELANTPLNENCYAIILKKLPKKLGDPRKFLISRGFSELKCKALADLGASINLMPLFVWKKLGLPELISTRMTLELANRAICTPAGIARDVFVPTFLTDSSSLIDVHGEEMILRDGDERLILNMRHDTSSYSNQPQKESINLINVFNNSKGGNVLSEKLLDLDSTKDLYPPLHVNPLSGSTTYSSNPLLEELADELALITFPLKYDDVLQFDVESDLKEIEFLLDKDSSLKDSIDQSNLANLADVFIDSIPEMFTDKHALDYSSPPIFDEYDNDFLEVESDAENVYDDPFDFKGEKIKESKLLIDELDLPCDFLPSKYDSFISQDFSRFDALPSTNNEDKVFNPGILSQQKSFEIITRVVQDKKLAISNASSMLEDFDPPFNEPFFFKEVPMSKMLLLFSSENEENVFKPGIHTSKKVHSSRIPELSHQGYKIFKINQIFKSLMKIFLFFCGKDTHILAISCLHFYPLDQFKYEGRELGQAK
nr:hypothetical protein [Tanacetum cinerariifolium]